MKVFLLMIFTLMCRTCASGPPPPFTNKPPPPVINKPPPPVSPPPVVKGPPPPVIKKPPPPVVNRPPPPVTNKPPPPVAKKPPPPVTNKPPPPVAKKPPPPVVNKSPPPTSPPPPAVITYQNTYYPPTGYKFCASDDSDIIGNNQDNSGNLFGYGAISIVTYCDSSYGTISGNLFLQSYVDPALCNLTSFINVGSTSSPTYYTLIIQYNGIGSIQTDAIYVPLLNNIYSVAGNWSSYEDQFGNIQYSYNGSGSPYSYYVDYNHNISPCGTVYSASINNQFPVAYVQTCDQFGNPAGVVGNAIGYPQNGCGGFLPDLHAYSSIDPYTDYESFVLDVYF